MTDIDLDEATLWHVEQGYDITDSVAFHGPPGTGKTTTAAATVGRLLRDHGYDIGDVAWVTYRRSLARDTLQRLAAWGVIDDTQLDEPHRGATRYIGTAHAVANRTAGIAEDPVEFWNKREFCNRRDIQYVTDEPWEQSPGKLIFRTIDWLAQHRARPTDTQLLNECTHYQTLMDDWDGDIVRVWQDWQDYKVERGVIDFYEMLEEPLRQGVSPDRDILVVDEYHDATQLMDDLFRSWMEDAEIVIAAGDPHQVVNNFDGADPQYFENLDLPKVLLPVTWRVPETHWKLATGILQNAHTPPDVDLRKHNGQIKEYASPRFEYGEDAGWARLPGRGQEGSPSWIVDNTEGSTLFLTRTQMQADGVGRALEIAGIPYLSQQDLRGWNTDKGEKRLLVHNALQKLDGYEPADLDYEGSNYGLNRYSTGSNERDPRDQTLTSGEVCMMLRVTKARDLDVTRSDAKSIVEDIEETDDTYTVREFDRWCQRSFWERYTEGSGSIRRLNKSPFGKTADRELEAIDKALKRCDGPVDLGDLNTWAITIHASKGMEADDVVVYDGITNRIRSGMRERTDTEHNEYRTWYVATSRSKKRLHIMRGGFEWTDSIVPDLREVIRHADTR